MAEYP